MHDCAATSLAQHLKEATSQLTAAGIETPDLDARRLCEGILGYTRSAQLLDADKRLTPDQSQRYKNAIARRAAGEPVGRILGERDFWGMTFVLSPATLEPRPDSETLIEAALQIFPDKQAPLRILDLGTGTGCLLAALLSEYQSAHGTAVDQSIEALKTAQHNLERHNLVSRARFIKSDWLDAVEGQFDLIISNPPYIAHEEEARLSYEVRTFDPKAALFADDHGLADYKRIISKIKPFLPPHGRLILELGQGQEEAVKTYAHQHFLTHRATVADLASIPRAIIFSL